MFLVTDATGHVGKAAVAELARRSAPVRVLARAGADAPIAPAGVEVVRCNLSDDASVQRVLAGVEGLFLTCPPNPQVTEVHARFARIAKESGVQHAVQLSSVGANAEMCCARMLRWFGHAESSLATSGLRITRLRPTMQMQTLLEFAPEIASQGVIAGPFRSTRWTLVDARDIAAVGVAALLREQFAGQTYLVTGRDFLTFEQVADRLSGALGKSIRYVDITANETRGRLRAQGVPPVMIEARLELWDACASNLINVQPSDVVRQVTGRDPRSLEEFAADYRAQLLLGTSD